MVAIAALAVAASSLVACNSDTPDNTGGGCDTANKKLELAFVYASTTQNPFQEMALGAQAAADADGNVNLLLSAPTGIDGPKQVSLFQAAARTATDGVAYMTVTPDLFVRPLNSATDSACPDRRGRRPAARHQRQDSSSPTATPSLASCRRGVHRTEPEGGRGRLNDISRRCICRAAP
jgi:hypothetical protein